jgi:hypothetical protein
LFAFSPAPTVRGSTINVCQVCGSMVDYSTVLYSLHACARTYVTPWLSASSIPPRQTSRPSTVLSSLEHSIIFPSFVLQLSARGHVTCAETCRGKRCFVSHRLRVYIHGRRRTTRRSRCSHRAHICFAKTMCAVLPTTWPLFGLVTHMWPIQKKKSHVIPILNEKLGGFRCVSPIIQYFWSIFLLSSVHHLFILHVFAPNIKPLRSLCIFPKYEYPYLKGFNALPSSKLETR